MKKARTECQSHKLTVEDPVTLEYITRYVAGMKQRLELYLWNPMFETECEIDILSLNFVKLYH